LDSLQSYDLGKYVRKKQINLHIPFFFRTFAAENKSVMKKISLFIFALVCAGVQAQTRYVGGDISMLPQYEQYSSGYKDVNNKKISDLISWCVTDLGWNTFRVRIFVHPQQKAPDYTTTDYAIVQDLAYVTALGKRIKDAGAYFMLDFHYSDSWVDAGHIQAPAAWKNLSDDLMADSLGAYTHMVLQTLKAAGATPDLVQVGNEIMYGLCGRKVAPYNRDDTNWPGYLKLLHAGCNAVREECPNAQIIIHTDRPCNKGYHYYYYDKLRTDNVDFDIIGLSYYPFWHADYTPTSSSTAAQTLAPLVSAMQYLAVQFPEKRVHIVETAYNFQYWPSAGVKYDTRPVWPCSVQGQYNFIKNLVDALQPLNNVDGINYWFPEDAGNGDYVNWTTKAGLVEETWSNRGFWNEGSTTTGHTINKTGNVSESKKAEDVCAPYYMRHFYHSGEGTSVLQATGEESRVRKILRDGQILIERGGSLYALDGSRL
jgi:arabinogalactan endo-1,4-beta-galactosidase